MPSREAIENVERGAKIRSALLGFQQQNFARGFAYDGHSEQMPGTLEPVEHLQRITRRARHFPSAQS